MKPHQLRSRKTKPLRVPRKVFAIFPEGEKTEPIYFRSFESTKNIRILFPSVLGNDPKSLVDSAIGYNKTDEAKIVDEIWIVVDTDFSHNHRKTKEQQLNYASRECINHKKFGFAVSNPCIEFWFLLHYKKVPKFKTTERVQGNCIKALREYYPAYEKKCFDPSILKPLTQRAIKNAKSLDSTREGDWPQHHGSTVYKLVEKLIAVP
jgi:hypothetical protein